MKKLGLSLAMGLVPFPALAVTVNVDAGTTATGGLINPVVTQNVYGTANDFSIYGTQQVMSGGLTNNSNVFSGGYQNISSGGTSNNSTIQVNAVQSISGTANGTKVEGSSTINRGGIANNTIVNGGKLSVLTGGSSVGTVLNSGTESVTGTSKDGIINGGLQQINRNGSATGTQINGGEQNIAVRGTATGSIISGGVQNVYGDAYTSEIKNNGTMNVYSTGYAENTNINGGTMIVNSGAFVSDTILNSGVEDVHGYDLNGIINGGTQYIENEGQADETTIQNAGTQQILSGGYGYNARIYRGGTQIANAGGYAYRSNIYDGGTLKAIGEAHESTIHDGGFLTVADEGKAIDTTINGGVLTVESGGTSQNTILSSGVENVYGTANGTQINGGEQNVYGLANNSVISTNGLLKVLSGGTAVDTSLNGGVLTVESGGTSQNTILSSGVENVYGTANGTQINGGEQNVYGLANNSVISTNGSLKVLSGGKAVDTGLNGGVLTVESGGTSQNTILSSGVENVYGTANGTQINGGKQNVYGLVTNAVITKGTQNIYGQARNTAANGGIITVFSGGETENTTLNNGTLNLQQNGKLSGTTIASTSLINIIGNNTITDLELDKSLVNMVKTNQYSTLDIENLNGTGLFRMNTNMSSSEADFINIKNGKGEFGLIVNDYSMDNAPNKYKIIDEGTATKDNFYLVGGAADVGAYQYKLVQEGNDWYLENTNKPNDTTYMAKNTYSSLSSLFYTHITPVYSRLYEKHGKHKHEGGIWTKGIGRRIKQNFDDGTSSQTDVYGASIGIDHSIIEGKDYQIRLGGYTSYSHSRQEFDQQGKSEGNTQSFGLYSSLTTENQWFLDLLGAYVTHNQSVNSYTPAGDAVIGKYDTYGWQTSLIGGRRFNFENSLYFEPHVALGYMWIKGISYRTNFNTLIEGSDQDNLKMSIGMTGGKTYQITEDATAEIFGKFSIIHDWKSESKVQVVDYLMKEDMSATHYKLGAGVKGNWDDNKSAFFEISTHMGNKVTMPYEITIGYQYEF